MHNETKNSKGCHFRLDNCVILTSCLKVEICISFRINSKNRSFSRKNFCSFRLSFEKTENGKKNGGFFMRLLTKVTPKLKK